jgi:hypothetical protein
MTGTTLVSLRNEMVSLTGCVFGAGGGLEGGTGGGPREINSGTGNSVPQPGHLVFEPPADESTTTCLPQAGHANFKSISFLLRASHLGKDRVT